MKKDLFNTLGFDMSKPSMKNPFEEKKARKNNGRILP